MKVILTPGPRNEELIQEILKKKNTLSNEEWEEYCIDNADRGEEFFDALYYTCENAEEMLHEQERYFQDLLTWDERGYVVARFGGFIECYP